MGLYYNGCSSIVYGRLRKFSEKKEQAKVQATEQPADSVTVIESETVVIAVDSIAPDSAAMKQKAPTPKKTK